MCVGSAIRADIRVSIQDRTAPDRVSGHIATGILVDGDIVLVPRGYHPVGVPAGYDCYYLNIMAGPTRAWHFTIDPAHAWLMDWDPGAPVAALEEASA